MKKTYHVKIVLHLLHEEDVQAESQEAAERIAHNIYYDLPLEEYDQAALEMDNIIEAKGHKHEEPTSENRQAH